MQGRFSRPHDRRIHAPDMRQDMAACFHDRDFPDMRVPQLRVHCSSHGASSVRNGHSCGRHQCGGPRPRAPGAGRVFRHPGRGTRAHLRQGRRRVFGRADDSGRTGGHNVHFLLRTEPHPGRTPPLPEAWDDLENALLAEKREAKFRQWVERLRASSQITETSPMKDDGTL